MACNEPISPLRLRYSESFGEAEVAWRLHVFNEVEALGWCAAEIRRHYPGSRIAVISDGDGLDYGRVIAEHRLSFVRGEQLRPTGSGHRYVVRLLETMLAGPETYLFKIDPDTWVRRRFRRLPLFSGRFGTIESRSELYRKANRNETSSSFSSQ